MILPPLTLARDLALSKNFMWQQGMLVVRFVMGENPHRFKDHGQKCFRVGPSHKKGDLGYYNDETALDVPDLTDPATLGWLLDIVRKLKHDARITVQYSQGKYSQAIWDVRVSDSSFGVGDSEGAALARAIIDHKRF